MYVRRRRVLLITDLSLTRKQQRATLFYLSAGRESEELKTPI